MGVLLGGGKAGLREGWGVRGRCFRRRGLGCLRLGVVCMLGGRWRRSGVLSGCVERRGWRAEWLGAG